MSKKKTHVEFINELNEINSNIKVIGEYNGRSNHVECECDKCNHQWNPIAGDLLSGKGCPKCAGILKHTTESFVNGMNDINPNITILWDYINAKTKIQCSCKICNHKWDAKPNKLQQGRGCPKCSSLRKRELFRFTNDDFLCTLFNKNNQYKNKMIDILDEYNGYDTRIACKCNICNNTWKTTPDSLLQGSGCPICKSSKGEQKICEYLILNSIKYEPQKNYENLVGLSGGSLSFDFYITDYNLLIEYQGEQHYHPVNFDGCSLKEATSNFKKQQIHDNLKRVYAKQNNIKLIEIPYYDYDNIEVILNNIIVESEDK